VVNSTEVLALCMEGAVKPQEAGNNRVTSD
jgi:hypothetical protein